MSRKNVEIAMRLADSLNRLDVDAWAELSREATIWRCRTSSDHGEALPAAGPAE